MKPYEDKITEKIFDETEIPEYLFDYTYPWNRKFEIEVHVN